MLQKAISLIKANSFEDFALWKLKYERIRYERISEAFFQPFCIPNKYPQN